MLCLGANCVVTRIFALKVIPTLFFNYLIKFNIFLSISNTSECCLSQFYRILSEVKV